MLSKNLASKLVGFSTAAEAAWFDQEIGPEHASVEGRSVWQNKRLLVVFAAVFFAIGGVLGVARATVSHQGPPQNAAGAKPALAMAAPAPAPKPAARPRAAAKPAVAAKSAKAAKAAKSSVARPSSSKAKAGKASKVTSKKAVRRAGRRH
jgi:hypothetical protein